ncbi:MAG: hypothetical protein GWP03_04645 [Proteobacteria bacterium]|nr:hypothetical protein [Pseudomonadota bacterium]
MFFKSILYLFDTKSVKVNGFISIVLNLISLFTVISVLTFDIRDLKTLLTLTPHNAGGILGVIFGKYLLLAFGIESFFIPLLLILVSYALVKTNFKQRFIWLLIDLYLFFLLLFPFTNMKVNSKLFTLSKSGDFRISGLIGKNVMEFFKGYTGMLGIILVLVVLFIVAVYLIHPFLVYRKKTKKETKISTPKPVEKRKAEVEKEEKKEKPKESEEKRKEIKIKLHKPIEEAAYEDIYKDEFKKQFLSVLEVKNRKNVNVDPSELERKAETLVDKLKEFGVNGYVNNISTGPVITMFEFVPAKGVKVSKVANLNEDLSLALKAEKIRMIVPLPGKSAIGIEVPNAERENVYLFDVITSNKFVESKEKLVTALGKDASGYPYVANIANMPHLLIAGTTGSGKSVCVNSIVASLLFRNTPEDVRFIMVDPKRLELPVYNGIPHLVRPVITEAKEAVNVLKRIVDWMEFRYKQFAKMGVRDIDGYNAKAKVKKPYIVIIIDELADLMMTAPAELEQNLTRLAQMSRAVGIHMVLATQRPSVDVITGLIKANFPARIAFQVASKTDSRTILDMNGAEKLLGRGDMLFLPPGKGKPTRLHGAFITTEQAKKLASMWAGIHIDKRLDGKVENQKQFTEDLIERDIVSVIANRDGIPGAKERIDNFAAIESEKIGISHEEIVDVLNELGRHYYPYLEENDSERDINDVSTTYIEENYDLDELFDRAKDIVIRHQVASVSLLQRQLKIGYARAGRIIDQLEKAGIVGPYVGSKSREVLKGRED